MGLRKQALAAHIGVSLTTIQQYENGQMPKGEFAVRLSRCLHCSLDWLLAGLGEESPGAASDLQQGHSAVLSTSGIRLTWVPLIEASCLRSGQNSFQNAPMANQQAHNPHGEPVTARFALAEGQAGQYFSLDFLAAKGNPACMAVLRVSGHSMQPHICHNDLVLIDQSQCLPMPGCIYAICVEDMIYLKFLDALPGKLLFSCVNAPTLEVPNNTEQEQGVQIIGRALWVGRDLA